MVRRKANPLPIHLSGHPHANEKMEVSNKTIVNGLKKYLMKSKGAWLEEFPTMLFSYRLTSRSDTREPPFRLIYVTEVVLPPEILARSLWVTDFDADANKARQRQDLDILD